MRRIGLLGGTFDPPHTGHVGMARAALKAGLVDEVLVIPAGDPWQKATYANADDRLTMARLAFQDEPYCIVHDIETRRSGPTYAIDTLEIMASPDLEMHYVIGSDTLAQLPTWRRIDDVAKLCTFLVVRRPGTTVTPPEIPGLRVEVVPSSSMLEASRDIRAELAGATARPGGLPDEVWEYIVRHRLYGAIGA